MAESESSTTTLVRQALGGTLTIGGLARSFMAGDCAGTETALKFAVLGAIIFNTAAAIEFVRAVPWPWKRTGGGDEPQ